MLILRIPFSIFNIAAHLNIFLISSKSTPQSRSQQIQMYLIPQMSKERASSKHEKSSKSTPQSRSQQIQMYLIPQMSKERASSKHDEKIIN